MDEINIEQPIQPERKFFISRHSVFTVLGIASAAVIVVLSFLFFERFFGPPGSLQITSLRPNISVSVDGVKVGGDGYRGDFRPGLHQVLVTDTNEVVQSWQGQVEISSGTLTAVEVDLGPSEDFSGSVVLSLNRGGNLSVKSSPAGAKVYLDGTNIGTTPVNRPNPGPGVHSLKLTLEGYLDKEVQINSTNGWQIQAQVKLYKNPSFAVKLLEEKEIKSTSASELTIADRESLGLDKILASSPPQSYASWNKAQFISLGVEDELAVSPEVYLKAVYLHSLAHLLLPDLPFHYLIDKEGRIYEGRSGGFGATSLDVSTSLETTAQAPTVRPGWVLVGYLGSKLTASASENFSKLVTFLGQPPKLAASTQPEATVSMDAAQKKELNFTFKNIGLATWFNFGDNRTTLTSDKVSSFFTSGNWLDDKSPATTAESYVPKGSEANFRFNLTAPKYGGDYEETYHLVQARRSVTGSEVKLKIHVNGPAKPPVQVKIEATPTGFLRVRSGPGTSYSEVVRVKPGEVYEFLEEKSGWYKIKVSETISGWVSTQFATKINL